MKDPYSYPTIVAVKVAIVRNRKVLLLREPPTNEWMPGRLGLPGGKPTLTEFLRDTIERKIRTEVGFKVEVLGIGRIVNIVQTASTVYHFVLVARHTLGEIDLSKTEAKELGWYGLDKITKMPARNFTEFYQKSFLREVLECKLKLAPLEMILPQDNRRKQIQEWMRPAQAPDS
jgi:ADP-ribose pyrophosphatase YjhB (NUDIX family)